MRNLMLRTEDQLVCGDVGNGKLDWVYPDLYCRWSDTSMSEKSGMAWFHCDAMDALLPLVDVYALYLEESADDPYEYVDDWDN